VNTAIIAMAQGLGFAVPSNTAHWVIGELLAHGQVRRRWLGISGRTVAVPRALARELDLVADEAVEIMDLDPQGPAAKAGLRTGDLVVAVAGRVTTSVDDLSRIITLAPAGEPLELTILRNERLIEIDVRPGDAQ
jgi:S1-C subfamily serine protease